MNCKVCGSEHRKLQNELFFERKIFSCKDCGVQYLDPQLNDEELKKLYAENYYHAWGVSGTSENQITRQMKRATFQLRMALIHQFVRFGKVLDVGCATGYFLEVAKEAGYEPFGVEFSNYSSQMAKRLFGDDSIFCGTLEQCDFPDLMFDVIAMSDFIEHVKDPIVTLTKASQLLKNDGVIMIMTPNTNTLSNKLMGKRWTHYKLEHFYYFNLSSLQILAEKCGLEVAYFEKSKKAMNIEYLYTQFRVYKHWLFTPLFSVLHKILPEKIRSTNLYISLGEMVLILKKKDCEK